MNAPRNTRFFLSIYADYSHKMNDELLVLTVIQQVVFYLV